MQRLLRLSTEKYSIDNRFSALLNDYDTVIKGMNHSLPPTVSSIFSRPLIQEDVIEWYSELQGQAFPLSELDKNSQAIVHNKLTDRLTSIKRWIGSPHANKKLSKSQQDLLSLLVTDIENQKYQIFSVNEEPVVVQWGASLKQPPQAVSAPPAPPPPPPPPVPQAVTTTRSFRILPWLLFPLLALLSLLLLGLLWWFLTLPLLFDNAAECHTSTNPQEKNTMMVAFDGSSSMAVPLAFSDQDIDEHSDFLEQQLGLDDRTQALKNIEAEYGVSRMTASKNALLSVIDKIDPSIDIGLLEFTACPSASYIGTFTKEQRKELSQTIQNLLPVERTPLIDALNKIAESTNPDKDAFALIISDGQDSCYIDNHTLTPTETVCSIAKDIAQQYPRLRINVLDIAEQGAANCIAEETGGKVFGVSNAADMEVAFTEAIKPMTSQNICKQTSPEVLPVWKSLFNGSLWSAFKEGKVSEAIHNDLWWNALKEGFLWEFIKQKLWG